MSTVAKALVVLILVLEVGVVVWLPRRMRLAALWEEQIARQRTVMLLDALRAENNAAAPADDMDKEARSVLRRELDALARYLRKNEEYLTRRQWRELHDDLLGYRKAMARLSEGTAFKPISRIDLDAGVRKTLGLPEKDDPAP